MEDRMTTLAKYRLDTAKEALDDAKANLADGRYKNSVNRSYYAIFNAARAVNVNDGFESKKHSGVISHFNQYYIKNEIFPTYASNIVTTAFRIRQRADYEDFYIVSKSEAESQVKNAETFIGLVEKYFENIQEKPESAPEENDNRSWLDWRLDEFAENMRKSDNVQSNVRMHNDSRDDIEH